MRSTRSGTFGRASVRVGGGAGRGSVVGGSASAAEVEMDNTKYSTANRRIGGRSCKPYAHRVWPAFGAIPSVDSARWALDGDGAKTPCGNAFTNAVARCRAGGSRHTERSARTQSA